MKREELLEVYKKYLFVETPHLIDVLAATYLTKDLPGDPVWLIPMGPSGYGKTEMSRPYMDLHEKEGCFFWDQLNAKAFASGSGVAEEDYGKKLSHKNSFAIIPDMANLFSMEEEEKKSLFAVLRTLFDGYIKRATGNKKPEYDGIHLNLVGLSTSAIERDICLSSMMGTREIMYRLPTLYSQNETLDCLPISKEARSEISRVTRDYLNEIAPVSFIEPNEIEIKQIKRIAQRMILWRAEGECDKDGYLLKAVEIESPKRLYTQITKLWKGLRKFGLSSEESLKRLREIETGMGNVLREKIYRKLTVETEEGPPLPSTIENLCEHFNVAESEVRKNLMILRSLGRIRKIGSEGSEAAPPGYKTNSVWGKK